MDFTIFRQRGTVALAIIGVEHIPLFLIWLNDPQITRYLGIIWPLDEFQEKKYMEGLYKPFGGHMNFLILIKDESDKWIPIGAMGLHKIDHVNQSAETGAMIGEEKYHGRGYGTQAKMLLLEYCFNYLNLRIVTSKVYGSNTRSLAYSKKCGYEACGTIPAYKYRDGKWEDEVTLAVTKKRFLALTKTTKNKK